MASPPDIAAPMSELAAIARRAVAASENGHAEDGLTTEELRAAVVERVVYRRHDHYVVSSRGKRIAVQGAPPTRQA